MIALLVGGAVAVTLLTLRGIARNAAIESLRGTAAAQTAFQEQRYRQLLLISRVFAADANISVYLSEAANTNNARSILDLLSTARNDLGFDFAIVLDPHGKVVARTDRPEGAGEDLSKRPLVAAAMAADNQESRGVWREGDRLYHAVAVPLAKDFTPFGSLITGFQIDDQAEGVKELRDVSGADVAFVASGPQGPKIVATTLPPDTARSLSTMLKGDRMGAAMRAGKAVPRTELALDGRPWIAVETPLRDANGAPVGATVALASLEKELASYRQIQ
ncbi:MAG TPA: cache domain-containing protein, partial [Thermoanaerobaculia bacterium]